MLVTTLVMLLLGTTLAPHARATGALHVEPGSTIAVTIRQAPGDCRAVVELLQEGLVVTDRSALVGADGRATLTIRFPSSPGRYLLQARLGGPRCPPEGLGQPVQQRPVVVG